MSNLRVYGPMGLPEVLLVDLTYYTETKSVNVATLMYAPTAYLDLLMLARQTDTPPMIIAGKERKEHKELTAAQILKINVKQEEVASRYGELAQSHSQAFQFANALEQVEAAVPSRKWAIYWKLHVFVLQKCSDLPWEKCIDMLAPIYKNRYDSVTAPFNCAEVPDSDVGNNTSVVAELPR